MIATIVVLTGYLVLHVFAYARVANSLGLTARGRLGLKIGLALAALPFVLVRVFGSTAFVAPFLLVAYTWLGVLAMGVALFPVAWLLSLFFAEHRKTITTGALVLLAPLTVYSLVNGRRSPALEEMTVSLDKLPAEVSGFTLVQLSDLHLGPLTSVDRLCGIVDRVNGLSPDLVVITGDLIEPDIDQEATCCRCLGGIKARYGVLAVAGNHDYQAGYERFLRVASCSQITVLQNERRLIAGAIQVAGVDEAAGRSSAEGGADLAKALAGSDPDRPVILLAHRPDGFDGAVRKGIDLQLSGHLHAGQIPPMDGLIWLLSPYSYGLVARGRSHIYTSCGTGTAGPPMRLFSRNEIVRFTLVRK